MKPSPGFTPLMAGTLVAVAALTACRKEVPPPPLPAPSQDPKPTVQVTAYAAAHLAASRLVA